MTFVRTGNVLDRLKKLTNKIGGFFSRSVSTNMGTQRPVSDYRSLIGNDNRLGRNFDREIRDVFVRDPHRLYALKKASDIPEINTCVRIISDDVFSSEHGDDIGLSISDWVDPVNPQTGVGTIPVNPKVKQLLDDFVYRYLGAEFCKPIVKELLNFGDSFLEIGFTEKLDNINNLLKLPVGEMFRVELNNGYLTNFEQRMYESAENNIVYLPLQVVHFRYNRNKLYGESLFESAIKKQCSENVEGISEVTELISAYEDLSKAAHDIGAGLIHHELDENASREDVVKYRDSHLEQKKIYKVTDVYTEHGVKISRVTGNSGDFDALIKRVDTSRKRLAMICRTPTYLLAGLDAQTKQLAGQPSTAYSRHISSVRQAFSEGINQILDTYLAINGIPEKEWRYRIKYPEIVVNPFNIPAPTNEQKVSQNQS